MQNPNITKASKQLHEVSEGIKESIDQNLPEFRNKVKEIASDTAEQLSEARHQAKGWIQENYGKTLGVIGAIALIGTMGYLIGRTTYREDLWSPKKES